MTRVTEMLQSIEQGDSDTLLVLVYDELRELAAARLVQESPGQTLQPTALVHEAYLRLVGGDPGREWANTRHFFAAASEAMRRILIERARRKRTVKHGATYRRIDLDNDSIADDNDTPQLMALDDALSELEEHDSQAAQLVKLRYFGGLSHQDAAAALQISRRTADRIWALAKAWLYTRLNSP